MNPRQKAPDSGKDKMAHTLTATPDNSHLPVAPTEAQM
jgi:hypothetical protein